MYDDESDRQHPVNTHIQKHEDNEEEIVQSQKLSVVSFKREISSPKLGAYTSSSVTEARISGCDFNFENQVALSIKCVLNRIKNYNRAKNLLVNPRQ